ncbi:MAG: DNA-3-methyladenine glycosylase 2 family protein [Clostridia bacterium]|nr:DNA-3-methyladenine glycosylase 2 family protein [Clostridia bacterium]
MFLGTEKLDLQLTLLDSAQCFRWVQVGERYGCVLFGSPVWLWADGSGIHAEGSADAALLRDYLDLDRDYDALAAEYAHIPCARAAIEYCPGLRVLNQPPWEALVCFILSANNNVARIRGLTQAICERFGEDMGGLYGFPTPERLADASEDDLRALRVGYRAPYLIGTARRVCDGFPLDDLCSMDYDAAHALLTTLPGVGDKVADCVLLFGCRHASAFPVDVWVARVMEDWFGMTCKSRAKTCRLARDMLGPHAGLLQQFLFHARRTGMAL